MEHITSVSVIEGIVLSCAVKNGVAKLCLQLSKYTQVVAGGVEFDKPVERSVSELKEIEIKSEQLDPSLVNELRLVRTGDQVRMNVLVTNEGATSYTLFNISEYSVPMRF